MPFVTTTLPSRISNRNGRPSTGCTSVEQKFGLQAAAQRIQRMIQRRRHSGPHARPDAVARPAHGADAVQASGAPNVHPCSRDTIRRSEPRCRPVFRAPATRSTIATLAAPGGVGIGKSGRRRRRPAENVCTAGRCPSPARAASNADAILTPEQAEERLPGRGDQRRHFVDKLFGKRPPRCQMVAAYPAPNGSGASGIISAVAKPTSMPDPPASRCRTNACVQPRQEPGIRADAPAAALNGAQELGGVRVVLRPRSGRARSLDQRPRPSRGTAPGGSAGSGTTNKARPPGFSTRCTFVRKPRTSPIR